jgi:hypothetical protein
MEQLRILAGILARILSGPPKAEAIEAVSMMLGHLAVAEAEVRDPQGRVSHPEGVDRDRHAVDKVLNQLFAARADSQTIYGTNFKQGLHGVILRDAVSLLRLIRGVKE